MVSSLRSNLMAIRQRRRRFLLSDSYYFSPPPPPSFDSDYHSSSPPLPSPSPQPSPYYSPPPPANSSFIIPHKSSKNITLIVVLFLCALAVAFLFLSYLTIRKQRNSRTRRIRINSRNSRRRRTTASTNEETENPANLDLDLLDDDHSPVDHPIWYIRTVGLQQSVIDSITIFKYKRGESLIEGADCSVCLSEFEEDETLRLLPKCSHAFHIHCIDTWLSSHQNCPLCRAPIVSSTVSVSDSPNNTVITISDQSQLDDDAAAAAAVNPDLENPMNSHSQRIDHMFPDEIDLRLAVDQFSVEVEDEEDQDRVSGVTYHKDLTQGRNSVGGGTRVLSDLGNHCRSVLKEEDEEEGSEGMGRRSVSMDALSAAHLSASFLTMAKAGGEGCSSNQEPASSSLKNSNKKKTKSNSLMDGNQDGHTSRVTKTYSFGRFLQRGSSGHDTDLKRSTSSASAASSSGGFFSLSSKH